MLADQRHHLGPPPQPVQGRHDEVGRVHPLMGTFVACALLRALGGGQSSLEIPTDVHDLGERQAGVNEPITERENPRHHWELVFSQLQSPFRSTRLEVQTAKAPGGKHLKVPAVSLSSDNSRLLCGRDARLKWLRILMSKGGVRPAGKRTKRKQPGAVEGL